MKKILLCIMDGIGYSNIEKGNAVINAKTPNLDKLESMYPHNYIEASGIYVGLPNGQMGNSEVGHLTIGSGRIVYQNLELINKSISNNEFYNNKSFINAINHAKKNNSKLHIMGLLSDGGVHSHINHFKELLKICKNENFENVYFHIFTDGRDTFPNSSINYLDDLNKTINKYSLGSIATISGRYYAMDRDKRWDRVQKTYNSIVNNIGQKYNSYKDLILDNYKNGVTDEFIVPSILDDKGNITDNDSIIWVNFRPDRSIQLLSSLTNDNFNNFETKKLSNIYLTTMMYVSDNIKGDIAFNKEIIDNTLGIVLSNNNKKQLRIAETEKYAHVTYFFDGGRELELDGCKRILVNSPKVATYDLKPEMSALEITNTLLNEMDNNYDFILLNYANGDMVGHTGDYDATIKAVETVDKMIGKLYDKAISNDYELIITADHGNAEKMIDEFENAVTSHTNNKVPFIVCNKNIKIDVKKLSDIAPFILKELNIKIPDEMK